ncbi:MAG: hypothetical protein F4Y99_09920 [Acidimicrobiaceae bacterium]|nr:hypothetical protein [Acidimicrobiaceae bacterium]MDE0517428.1 hypothetical protein [Acidimicrobiaceae bacterium]MDE0656085.1 hypothetical protein [Acidimicrobiaceae bacterium]MXZ96229.1 hypothetical protein [Acidimicrobiaceae bacterium]MYF44286.1 hypothetical protein [Acidimicrobiaceae bacterium]
MKIAVKSAWWHRLLLVGLVVAMVAAALLLGASSMRTWMDQNAQQREAESLATELDARIAELEGEVARRTSDDGVRREALCFGPYVEPGTEVYAVMGLEGCVSQPQDP